MSCPIPGCPEPGPGVCREHWDLVPDTARLYLAHCSEADWDRALAIVAILGWLHWDGRRGSQLPELARLVRVPPWRQLESVLRLHWPRDQEARDQFVAWARQQRARP